MMPHNQHHTYKVAQISYKALKSPAVKPQDIYEQLKSRSSSQEPDPWCSFSFKLHHVLGNSGGRQLQPRRSCCFSIALWETGDYLKPCALAPKNLSSKAAMKNSAEVRTPCFFLQIAQSPRILVQMKAAFQALAHQREFQNQAKQVQLCW